MWEIPRGSDGEADKKVMFQRGIFKVEYSLGLDGVQAQIFSFLQSQKGAKRCPAKQALTCLRALFCFKCNINFISGGRGRKVLT